MTVSALALLGEGWVDEPPLRALGELMVESRGWESPSTTLARSGVRLLVGDSGFWLLGMVPDADVLVGDGTASPPSRVLGLKKPFRDFCPGAQALDGATDFDRLTGIAGAGWDRLRDKLLESWLSRDVDEGLGASREGKDAGAVTSDPKDATGFSVALAVDADRDKVLLGGLRANMSLMLRRFSTSNSGSKRPEAGNKYRDEYSS